MCIMMKLPVLIDCYLKRPCGKKLVNHEILCEIQFDRF